MKKTLTKILHIVVDILVVAILIISVFVLTLALTTRGSDGVPTIFGKSPIGVLSDSMKGDKPDDFSKGDLIICDTADKTKDNKYKVGDIVTFAADINGDEVRDYVTHRIYKVNKDGTYQTKGDNSKSYDQNPANAVVLPDVAASDVLAVYHGWKIEGLGGVLNYLQSPEGFFLCILLPMIIFFLYQAVRVVINAMAYSKEKGMLKAQEAMDKAGLTEEQKQKAIAEYLAAQEGKPVDKADSEQADAASEEAEPQQEEAESEPPSEQDDEEKAESEPSPEKEDKEE